jgi:NitT/TauT family transport system ATP-binding protein
VGLDLQHGEESKAVLQDISLVVETGRFVCIVGPSGSGKTSLLRLIDGLLKPTRGEVLIDGGVVAGPGPNRGFVFQSDRLLPWRTVVGNIAFSLEARGVPRRVARERAADLVRLTGLEGFEQYYPAQLSGGMRQRVNLARALAPNPQILLMDEPFAALDAQTREIMQLELTTIWSGRQTVVFVTHQLDEAAYLADRVVVLSTRPGRVRGVIDVPLPRPRPLDIKRSAEFSELVGRLWLLVRDEMMAARRI